MRRILGCRPFWPADPRVQARIAEADFTACTTATRRSMQRDAAEKLLRTMLCGFNRNGQAFAPLQACVRPRKAAERERAEARETPSIRRVSTAAELDSEIGAPLEEDEWRER